MLPCSIIKTLPIYRGNRALLDVAVCCCDSSDSVLDDLIARLLPCGCVTSVEEGGGETAGVNVSGLAGLRCEKLLPTAV